MISSLQWQKIIKTIQWFDTDKGTFKHGWRIDSIFYQGKQTYEKYYVQFYNETINYLQAW